MRVWLESNVPNGIDGELISGKPDIETCYGTTFSAVMTQNGTPEFAFYVFDLCNSSDVAIARKAWLKTVCIALDNPRIIFVEQDIVSNDEQMLELYEKYLSEGYEGAILVDPDGLYKYGKATPKSQEQIKLKPEEDFEGEILETLEAMLNENEAYTNDVGETKRSTHAENKSGKGMVGGYRVRDVLTNTIFKVGAGKMTHAERIAEWEAYVLNPLHRKGGYLKYRSMSYGAMTNDGARHGRWIGWRDKADMNPEDVCDWVGGNPKERA
jgi:DNA ligase-1